jgi:hypothetical protein
MKIDRDRTALYRRVDKDVSPHNFACDNLFAARQATGSAHLDTPPAAAPTS